MEKKAGKAQRKGDRRKTDRRWMGGITPKFDKRKTERRMGERREKK